MTEKHPFISKEKFKNAKTLFLGSFPCKKEGSYGHWYYSGSGRNYFWEIMSAIAQRPLLHYDDKIQFCKDYRIAITDLFLRIARKHPSCRDADLTIKEFNLNELRCVLNENPIVKILFTSKFVENSFANFINRTYSLKELIQKKEITCKTIVSPSPNANIAIAALADYKSKKTNTFNTVDYRKMIYYREIKNP